jgi:hypothetical protein
MENMTMDATRDRTINERDSRAAFPPPRPILAWSVLAVGVGTLILGIAALWWAAEVYRHAMATVTH